MSNIHRPINLIKHLYDIYRSREAFDVSPKCRTKYKELYNEELPKVLLSCATDKKLINVVELIGIKNCISSNPLLILAIGLIPEELKSYILVNVNRKQGLTIDYDKAYADILHKQILDCESGEISDGQLVNSVYEQYMRIKYIEEKMDKFIYEKPLDTSIFTLVE